MLRTTNVIEAKTSRSKKWWLGLAASVSLGILSGAGFVALHFPIPPGEEVFHVSQLAESVAMSVAMTLFWGLVCIVGGLCASIKTNQRPWRRAWIAALVASLAVGLLVASFLGYSSFMGEERDWFKNHDRFVMSDYIATSVQFGFYFGALVTAAVATAASGLVAVSHLICKLTRKRGNAISAQQR